MKYDIYLLLGDDGVYNSKFIETVDSLEQAEDRVAELRAETGCSAYYEENNKLDEEATQASAVASGTNGQISVFGSDAGNKFIKHNSEDIYKELFELKDYDSEEECNIYTCMDCGNEFEDFQAHITDADGNPSCPFCGSGDVAVYNED